MTNDELVNVIIEKIGSGELSMKKLNKMVSERKKELFFSRNSSEFKEIFDSIKSFLTFCGYSYETFIEASNVFEVLTINSFKDEKSCIETLKESLDKNDSYVLKKVFSSNYDELNKVISACLKRSSYIFPETKEFGKWENLDVLKKVTLLRTIIYKIKEYKEWCNIFATSPWFFLRGIVWTK